MRIQLFTGDGWAPFQPGGSDSVSWQLPGADHLNLPASTEKLADVFQHRVKEIYPDADIEVLPHAAGQGRLASVDVTGDSPEAVDDALALTNQELESGGFEPGAMIEGEIEGLLAGIIDERGHTWKVER
jgi:hypothetical protein